MIPLQIEPPVPPEEAERQSREWADQMVEAGVPPGAPWRHVRVWQDGAELRTVLTWPARAGHGRFILDQSWTMGDWTIEPNYVVEVFGAELIGPLTPPFLVLRKLVIWGHVEGRGAVRSERDMAIRVWRETARYQGSRVYLDRRWDPDGEQEWLVRADKGTPPPTLDESAVALQAAPMLTKLTAPGPDIGFNIEPEEEVIRLLKAAVRTMRYEGTKFKLKTVWATVDWEKDAYYTRVNRYGITLDDVRRWYYESPTKSTPRAGRD